MTITPIDLSPSAPDRRITVMSYGAWRSGKTRFFAGFPRPLFLSEASERGWETIRTMPKEDFFEPDVTPEVWPIAKPSDMMAALAEFERILVHEPDRFRTIVIDALTHYADQYFGWLEDRAQAGQARVDKRQLYQELNAHLQYLQGRVHEYPVHVGWCCLEKPPDNGVDGTVMLSGQSAEKIPSKCDYVFYHRKARVKDAETFEIRTQYFNGYRAGGRDGGRLPDPLPVPHFACLADLIGLYEAKGEVSPPVEWKPRVPVQTAQRTPPSNGRAQSPPQRSAAPVQRRQPARGR